MQHFQLKKLYKLIDIINNINKLFQTKTIIYGHAGNGNLHIMLITKITDKQIIKKIATKFFIQVIKEGGTITGEHGDGLARSEFVKLQDGSNIYR